MNFTRFLSYMKHALMIVAMLTIVGISGCDDNDDKETPVPTESSAEIISGDSDLSQFAAFLEADPELKGYVEGTAEYTVFAPNNAAFEKLKATLGTDDLSIIAPNVIGAVLKFHFVNEKLLRADLYGKSATTLQGENVSVTSAGFVNEAGSDADGAEILQETEATNGVVYEVETILIPPTVFAQIGLNLATLAQPVLLGATFTDVVSIIAVADSNVPTGEMAISSILADKTKMYTAFLPVNEVFAAVATVKGITKAQLIGSVTASPAIARGFLLNHIAEGQVFGEDIEAGTQFTMESGLIFVAAEVPVSQQTPQGLVLVLSTDQEQVFPIFLKDAYKAVVDDGSGPVELDGAINGSLHVSAPLIVQ